MQSHVIHKFIVGTAKMSKSALSSNQKNHYLYIFLERVEKRKYVTAWKMAKKKYFGVYANFARASTPSVVS